MKTCSSCKEEKDTALYSRDKTTKDGLQRRCKACCSRLNKEWRENNPEYHKKWRAKNPDKLRKYYEKNVLADYPYVYKVDCPDGTFYYGCTVKKIRTRIQMHRLQRRGLKGFHTTLGKAMNENGWRAKHLNITVLGEFDTLEEAKQFERDTIRKNIQDPNCLNKKIG